MSVEAVAASLWRLSLAADGTRVDLAIETIDGREQTLRVETDGFDYDTHVGGAAGGLNVSAEWLPTWLRDLPADEWGATHRLVADSTGETTDFGALESEAPTVVMRSENDDGDVRVCPVGTIRAVEPINRRND